MNSGGNFFKNKILSFTKKGNNDGEDIIDEHETINDEEFFDDFFASSKDERAQKPEKDLDDSAALPTPKPAEKPEPIKAPIFNPVEQMQQASTPQSAPRVAPVQAPTPTANYKYDYAKMNDYSSTQAKAQAPIKKTAPKAKEQNYSYSSAPEAKVYAVVLKSADDVRAVVDCMLQKQMVAIYVDMSTLSKLEERRALDFIDGAKYVLKAHVKCISSKIYMVTQKNVGMDGDFMDFSQVNNAQYAKAQGESKYY